jgi:RNA polymerase sigma-70 factor (ECF subfamily)
MSATLGAGQGARDLPLVLPNAAARSDADPMDFDALFLAHYPRVVALISRVVRDRTQAEHLAADVFWKLYRTSPDGSGGKLGGWLYRTALRMALDALRVSSRRGRHETAAESERTRVSQPGDPLASLLVEEKRAQVRSTLASMKPRQSRMLLLRASGLSYQEIADALGLNPRSVGTLLARAEDTFDRHFRAMHGNRT